MLTSPPFTHLLNIQGEVILSSIYFQTRFTDLARQIETFFIQKRFLVYAHKPELILREDSSELRAELQRKDELIRRHYEKMAHWQALLQDMKEQQQPPQPQNAPGLQPGAKMQPGSPLPPQPGQVPVPQGPAVQGPGTPVRPDHGGVGAGLGHGVCAALTLDPGVGKTRAQRRFEHREVLGERAFRLADDERRAGHTLGAAGNEQ